MISPPASFYPNLDNLKETFGDPKIRVKWGNAYHYFYYKRKIISVLNECTSHSEWMSFEVMLLQILALVSETNHINFHCKSLETHILLFLRRLLKKSDLHVVWSIYLITTVITKCLPMIQLLAPAIRRTGEGNIFSLFTLAGGGGTPSHVWVGGVPHLRSR